MKLLASVVTVGFVLLGTFIPSVAKAEGGVKITPPVVKVVKAAAETPLQPQSTVEPVAEPEPISAPVPEPVAAPVVVAPVVGCGSDPNMAYIYQHESGCRTNAVNASSGAYGLCQALPAYKMASAGADWQTNWDTQNSWCISYANSRYGSPYLAMLAWEVQRWW